MTDSGNPSANVPAPIRRPRRLRSSPVMRRMTAETSLTVDDLILPMFVADGLDEVRPISSLPGVVQHTEDSLVRAVEEAAGLGIPSVDLFGVPLDSDKDGEGACSWREDGVLNRALSRLRREFGDDVLIMADTCLDEFTDHGHCGVVREDRWGRAVVDNDATLDLYQKMAVAQADAGAHIISPSGMMDGQILAIREALDAAGHQDVSIMAYSAKYASAFYGPFREAVASTLDGDRRTYQQDPANRREGLREAELDLAEGADMVMVKPAGYYLDVLSDVAAASDVPVAAYQVSGEYAMVEAAAHQGWIDRRAAVTESVTAIVRAGADIVLTYWAEELAKWLK